MQDPDNLSTERKEDDISDAAEANNKEDHPDLASEFETTADLESKPGGGEPETPEDEGALPVEEAVVPEAEMIEPLEGLPTEEELAVEEKVEESKARRFFRKLIRWTAGLLIIFGLGLITSIIVFYRPAVKEAETTIQQLKSDISAKEDTILDLQEQITDLKSQIAELEPLEGANNDLLAAQADFQLHIAILDARLDVANAMLSLKGDDIAQARVVLNNTGKTLETISELLEPGQRDVVVAMVQRLDLVLSEIEEDPYAAESDLDVLSTNLLQLEDAFFSD